MASSLLMIFLLIAIAIIPVVIILMFVYKKDKNKEPIGLLISLFVGGIFSCFLVITISRLLSNIFPFMTNYNGYLDVFLHAFVGVALVEEICKFLITYALAYRHKEFDEIYDMLSYAIFVALGFACFENVLYIMGNETVISGLTVGIQRAITAIPGHACYGLFMGYHLSLAKVSAKRKNKILERNNVLKAIFIPTAIHGIYDFCCFTGSVLFLAVFVVFIIIIDIISLKKLNYVAKINRGINEKTKPSITSATAEILEEAKEMKQSVSDNSLVHEANSYNQHTKKRTESEYFTIAPQTSKPTASSNGDTFKFEGSGVPYVPDLMPTKAIDYAPIITKEQSAEYVPVIPEESENQPIPEIPVSHLPEPPKSFCVYCGAKLQGDFCQSCGHEVK